MFLKNYRNTLALISLVSIFTLSNCTTWEDGEPQSIIIPHYTGDASFKLNGGLSTGKCNMVTVKGDITIHILSEYSPGLAKSLYIKNYLEKGKFQIKYSDTLSSGKARHRFSVVDVDANIGRWILNDDSSQNNYLIIDSINSDTTYVAGRFSGDYVQVSGSTNFWKRVNDTFLSDTLKIRNGKFEGEIWEKFY